MLELRFEGVTFEEKFLIADIRMAADFPTERRFWFDPRFHSGQSALMHRQPGNAWRIDLQLGPDADVEEEQKPDRVLPRLRRMLGDREFSLEWVSIYRFNCRRLGRFLHGRVVFVGDSAHQVSPFGARGANSGVQDAENLAWKLAAVLQDRAGNTLLESYNTERVQGANENIAHSTRSTDFIAPRSPAERCLRNAVLALAPEADFARRMVNSGRLSTATTYDSPLSTPDEDVFGGTARLGAPIPDAPLRSRNGRNTHLLEQIPGDFVLLTFANEDSTVSLAGARSVMVGGNIADTTGQVAKRLDASPGTVYLLRPDQHVCARWREFDPRKARAALERALGRR